MRIVFAYNSVEVRHNPELRAELATPLNVICETVLKQGRRSQCTPDHFTPPLAGKPAGGGALG